MTARINTIIIESPGILATENHREAKPFSDSELGAIRQHISEVTIASLPNDNTAVALHRLLRLLEMWRDNSP